VAKQF